MNRESHLGPTEAALRCESPQLRLIHENSPANELLVLDYTTTLKLGFSFAWVA